MSVAAYGSAQITVNTSKTGYVPLGIIGIGIGDQAVGISSYRNYSTSTIFVFRNYGSTAKNNVAINIRVLYRKA